MQYRIENIPRIYQINTGFFVKKVNPKSKEKSNTITLRVEVETTTNSKSINMSRHISKHALLAKF